MKPLDQELLAWRQFEKTGQIGAYLMYRAMREEREKTGRR